MKQIFITLIYILIAVSPLAAQTDTLLTESQETEVVADSLRSVDALSCEELWERGNNAYINGNYSRAIRFYEAIESRELMSLPLYYNLANGYFKLGDVAKSMLYYHRALKINPSDVDTKHNIEVVQTQTKDKIDAVPLFVLSEWSNIVGSSISIVGWCVISIIAWAALLVFFILFLLSRQLSQRKVGFYGAILSAIVMFASVVYAVQEGNEVTNNDEAIIMTQSSTVKSSPSTTSTDLFILHAGTKVEVISSLEGWSQVVIADGRQGWVKSEQIEII